MLNILLIDKPAGITSHDVVDAVRRITGERRVGHAGTLDPFATGLLIVAVGREETKKISEYVGLDKEYEAVFKLFATSDTNDKDGVIVPMHESKTREISESEIYSALQSFIGEIRQIPPAYSAIKIGGKKMYEAARAGAPISAGARLVRVNKIELLSFDGARLRVRISCGSGTYIRAIARDLGEKLGVGAYVEELRRTKIGNFRVEDAKTLKELADMTKLG